MAASPLGQTQVNALDPFTFPLSSSRLIEASAGTGKTFTIALLYLRLILGHGCTSLMPPQILVTTFTQAAADELRERIRARLAAAARTFSQPTCGALDPHLAELSNAYTEPSARAQAVFRLTQAANWMDEAAIFTIHGWCQRMLTEHAFHSRALFEQTVLTSLAPVIEQAVQDYWRIHVYALPQSMAVFAARCLGNPAALAKKLQSLLQRDGSTIWVDGAAQLPAHLDFTQLIATLAVAEQAIEQAEAHACAAWLNAKDTLILQWTPLIAQLSGSVHKTLKNRADFASVWLALDAWAEQGVPLPSEVVKFLTEPKFNKNMERPDHPALVVFSAWSEAIVVAKNSERDTLNRLWTHAAYWTRDRINTVLQHNGEMGFDDILLNFAQALRGDAGEQLALSLRVQYPVAMIDEFQDTDPLQFQIFDRVFQITHATRAGNDEPAGTVVLIGDPKQSIYRFRGADMESYLSARRATDGRHYTLTGNYRSTPALVAAVNHLFTHAETQPQGAFGYKEAADNPVPFVPVQAQGKARRLLLRNILDETVDAWADVPALTCWVLPSAEVHSAGEFESILAEHTASAIAQRLNQGQAGHCVFESESGAVQPLAPQDIAVLVSKGTQAASIQRALNRRGIKSVFLSDRHRLFTSPEAADVYRWLLAMAEPQQLGRVRAALGSAALCRSWTQLDALRDDELLDIEVARFVRYGQLWQTRGVLAAIYQLLHDYAVPAALLAAPFAVSSGERRLTNVLHLSDWAQNEQAQLAGRDALLQRFTVALNTARDAEQELRLEQDEHLVQIMTIHSAKGLQYPVVYLPFLPLIQGDNSQKKAISTPWRSTAGRVMSLGDFPAAAAAEKKERLAEGLRLIYVALTRAESACYMALGPVKFGRSKHPNQEDTPLGYVLGLCGKDEFAASFSAAQQALAACSAIEICAPPPINLAHYSAPRPDTLHPARAAKPRLITDWRMSSFSGLTQHLHDGQAPLPMAGALRVDVPETPSQDRWQDAFVEGVQIQAILTETALSEQVTNAPSPESSLAARVSRLPRGTVFGTQLHRLFELAGAAGFSHYATPSTCTALLAETDLAALMLNPEQHATLAELVQRILTLPLRANGSGADAAIQLVALHRYQIELEFWLPVSQTQTAAIDVLLCASILPQQPRPPLAPQALHGQIKGFMDLVFEADGRFYVLDYKSNWLGDTADAYAPARLREAMLVARYDLQMGLYLAALHRHLQDRLPNYDPAQHLGGAFYLFVRGIDSPGAGVFFARPDGAVITALDALLQASPDPQAEAA
ncbi:MAG: exodeoxyribonuclease V subunit beta [Halothiobacillus sp.]